MMMIRFRQHRFDHRHRFERRFDHRHRFEHRFDHNWA